MDRPELLCVPRAALDYITELETELAEVKAELQKAVSYAAECAGETNTLAHQLAEMKALAQAVVDFFNGEVTLVNKMEALLEGEE